MLFLRAGVSYLHEICGGGDTERTGIPDCIQYPGAFDESRETVHAAFGLYDDYLVGPLAQVLADLGVKKGMVVYGQDKLDEISLSRTDDCLRDPGRMDPKLCDHPGGLWI